MDLDSWCKLPSQERALGHTMPITPWLLLEVNWIEQWQLALLFFTSKCNTVCVSLKNSPAKSWWRKELAKETNLYEYNLSQLECLLHKSTVPNSLTMKSHEFHPQTFSSTESISEVTKNDSQQSHSQGMGCVLERQASCIPTSVLNLLYLEMYFL